MATLLRGARSVSKLDRRNLRQLLSCTPPLRFAHGYALLNKI
jgi:hypothetical protein